MKKIFILSIVLLNSLIGYSQINTWIINKGSILVGTYSSGQVINARNPDTRERFSFKHITFYPRVGVQITKNFLGGVYGNYGWIEGNLHPNFSYSGIGYFGRYYFFPT